MLSFVSIWDRQRIILEGLLVWQQMNKGSCRKSKVYVNVHVHGCIFVVTNIEPDDDHALIYIDNALQQELSNQSGDFLSDVLWVLLIAMMVEECGDDAFWWTISLNLPMFLTRSPLGAFEKNDFFV